MRRGFVACGLAGTQSRRRFPILASGGGLRFALGVLFAGFARVVLLFRQWHLPAGHDLTGFAGPRFLFAVLFAGFAHGVEFHQWHFIAGSDLAGLGGRRGFATLFGDLCRNDLEVGRWFLARRHLAGLGG